MGIPGHSSPDLMPHWALNCYWGLRGQSSQSGGILAGTWSHQSLMPPLITTSMTHMQKVQSLTDPRSAWKWLWPADDTEPDWPMAWPSIRHASGLCGSSLGGTLLFLTPLWKNSRFVTHAGSLSHEKKLAKKHILLLFRVASNSSGCRQSQEDDKHLTWFFTLAYLLSSGAISYERERERWEVQGHFFCSLVKQVIFHFNDMRNSLTVSASQMI